MPKIRCPHSGCDERVEVQWAQAGQVVNCPNGHPIRIPQLLNRFKQPAQSTPTDEGIDWAELETGGRAVDQRVRLACPECGHEFATRITMEQSASACPKCNCEVSTELRVRRMDDDETVAARQKLRRRKQAEHGAELREERGWKVLEQGLNHIVFATTVALITQIWAVIVLGPLLIPLIIAADASHPEDVATILLIFHGLVYVAEILLACAVIFHHDEILGSLGNGLFATALVSGVGMYWLPILFGPLAGFCAIVIPGALLAANVLAGIRLLWGFLLCLLAPIPAHIRVVLIFATCLAIACVGATAWMVMHVDFPQLIQPQNGRGLPDFGGPQRPLLMVGLGGNLAHLVFAEFIRQVMVARNDSKTAEYVSGYQGWFIALLAGNLLVSWIVIDRLLPGITIAFILIALAVADILLRDRFIIALDTARARCS